MSLRNSIRPILTQVNPALLARHTRLYASTPPKAPTPVSEAATSNQVEAESSIPIPRPSQSEPLPPTPTKKEELELGPLPRPLGTPILPSSAPKTWSDKKESYLNEDRQKAKRKALFKEASQGYFHDYNKARKAFGGKLWMAPSTLIREDRALYFPDINGRSLTGENRHTTDILKGKVSLVTLLNTRLSEEHAQSFTQAVVEDWKHDDKFSLVQINHQRNPLKSMLLNFFVSSLKRTIPEQWWNTYLVAGGDWSEFDINHPLGIENKILGYVYLVDANLKIRWAGNAMATEEEAANLRRAAGVLMGRMEQTVGH